MQLKVGDAIELGDRIGIVVTLPRREDRYNYPGLAYINPTEYREIHIVNTYKVVEAPAELRAATALPRSRMFSSKSGIDPEVFAVDAKGAIIPAWKYLPAESEATIHGCIKSYWDGFQAEFNTGTSAPSCHETLTGHAWHGLNQIRVAAMQHDPKATLLAQDVVRVEPRDLSEGIDAAVALGCAPSANAYDIPHIEDLNGRTLPIRFSGCHYHFSIGIGEMEVPKWFPDGTVIMMDKIAGLALTALGRDLEDPTRRKYYGRPGEYRLPKQPVPSKQVRLEYRTPGSFVIRSPRPFIFGADMARMGMKLGMVLDGRESEIPDVKDIILNCDADAAWKMINKHKSFFERIFKGMYGETVTQTTFEVLRKGFRATKPNTLEAEWGLGSCLPSSYRWKEITI